MVNLLFIEDDAALTKPGVVRSMYDPTAGTGRMLSVADEHLTALKPAPDADLRDTENVPLHEDVSTYFAREVLAHAPDAWIDHDKTKIGYEIPFHRHFYVFKPPRPLAEIDAELKIATDRIVAMIGDLSK